MFEEEPGSRCGWSRVRVGEAAPAGPCGHSRGATLRKRNRRIGGFSAEEWHSVNYIGKRGHS